MPDLADVGTIALVENHAAKQSPSRIEELVGIFIQATRVSAMDVRTLGFEC